MFKLFSTTAPLRGVLACAALVALNACSSSATPEELVSDAQSAIAKKDVKAAEIHLKNALQQAPNNAHARFMLGQLYFNQGLYADAEKELDRAVAEGFDANQSYPLLLEAKLASDPKTSREVVHADPARVSDPLAKARVMQQIGRAHLTEGRKDKAKEEFVTASKFAPEYDAPRVSLVALAATGRPTGESLAEVDGILQTAPQSVDALSLKADLLLAEGKKTEAQPILNKILELSPQYTSARVRLTVLLIDEGKHDEARKNLAILRQFNPSSVYFYYLTALIEFKEKNLQASEDALAVLLKDSTGANFAPGLALASRHAIARGDFSTAESRARATIGKAPNQLEGYQLLAIAQLKSNQHSAALETAESMIERGVKDASLLSVAGEAALSLNQVAKAERYFQAAATLDPKDPSKRTGLAIARIRSGAVEQGFADLQAASDLSQDNLSADYALILARMNQKQYDKAIEGIRQLEKKPNAGAIAANLEGLVYLSKNDNEGARVAFNKAISKDPKFFAAVANLAALEYRANRADEAKKHLAALIKVDPNHVDGLLAMAAHELRHNSDKAEASKLYERAYRENPTSVQAILAFTGFQMKNQQAKQAIPILQGALEQNVDNPALLEALGAAQTLADDRAQALATFQKLLALRPNWWAAHMKVAELQLLNKDEKSALSSFKKAASLAPNEWAPKIGLAKLHLSMGQKNEAIAVAKEIQSKNPGTPEGLELEGDLLASDGRWLESAAAFEKALKKATLDPRLHSKYYRSLARAGKTNDAEAHLKKLLKEHPEDIRIRAFAGEVAINNAQWPEAVQHYQFLVEKQPQNVLILNNLAWSMHQAKHPDALKWAEKAFTLAPKFPQVLDTLGTILVERGEGARGVPLLQDAVNASPATPEFRLNLAKGLIATGNRGSARRELEIIIKDHGTGAFADPARRLLSTL